MHLNYKQVVNWDANVIDVGFYGSEQSVPSTLRGLAGAGVYIVAGAPASVVGQWAPGAIVQNAIDGTMYIMNGTTAVPTWVIFAAGNSLTTLTKKVTLTSAQILALNSTPISLLPAPGAGLMYEVISVKGRINFLTAAYATHTELDITDATTGDILFKDTATLLAATSTKLATIPPNINSNAGVVVTANGAINAAVAVGNPATGAGTVDLYLTYKIITL